VVYIITPTFKRGSGAAPLETYYGKPTYRPRAQTEGWGSAWGPATSASPRSNAREYFRHLEPSPGMPEQGPPQQGLPQQSLSPAIPPQSPMELPSSTEDKVESLLSQLSQAPFTPEGKRIWSKHASALRAINTFPLTPEGREEALDKWLLNVDRSGLRHHISQKPSTEQVLLENRVIDPHTGIPLDMTMRAGAPQFNAAAGTTTPEKWVEIAPKLFEMMQKSKEAQFKAELDLWKAANEYAIEPDLSTLPKVPSWPTQAELESKAAEYGIKVPFGVPVSVPGAPSPVEKAPVLSGGPRDDRLMTTPFPGGPSAPTSVGDAAQTPADALVWQAIKQPGIPLPSEVVEAIRHYLPGMSPDLVIGLGQSHPELAGDRDFVYAMRNAISRKAGTMASEIAPRRQRKDLPTAVELWDSYTPETRAAFVRHVATEHMEDRDNYLRRFPGARRDNYGAYRDLYAAVLKDMQARGMAPSKPQTVESRPVEEAPLGPTQKASPTLPSLAQEVGPTVSPSTAQDPEAAAFEVIKKVREITKGRSADELTPEERGLIVPLMERLNQLEASLQR